jgi:hypothetical protein
VTAASPGRILKVNNTKRRNPHFTRCLLPFRKLIGGCAYSMAVPGAALSPST